MVKRGLASFCIISILALLPMVAYAQIGEVAGALVYNISIGSTNTLQLTIFNGGPTPLSFQIVQPVFQQIPNTTTPIVTIHPLNGTIQSHESFKVNVTVFMPRAHNKPGLRWDGLIQIIQTANQTITGGATIQGGVGKEIVIVAATPVINPYLYLLAGIIIAAAIAGIVYKLWKRGIRLAKAGKRTELIGNVKLSYMLILVGGIILAVASVLSILLASFAPAVVSSIANSTKTTNSSTATQSQIFTVIHGTINSAFVPSIVGIIASVILLLCAFFILEDPSKIKILAVVALIASIVSLYAGGGLYIGFIIALIGAIFGLAAESARSGQRPRAPARRAPKKKKR